MNCIHIPVKSAAGHPPKRSKKHVLLKVEHAETLQMLMMIMVIMMMKVMINGFAHVR